MMIHNRVRCDDSSANVRWELRALQRPNATLLFLLCEEEGRRRRKSGRQDGRKEGRKEEREVALDHVAGKVGGANFPYLASLGGCSIGIIEVYLVPRLRFPPTQPCRLFPSRSSLVSVQFCYARAHSAESLAGVAPFLRR